MTQKNFIESLFVPDFDYIQEVKIPPILQYKENDEWIDVPMELFPFPNPEDYPDITKIM